MSSVEVYNIKTDQWSFSEKRQSFPFDSASSFIDGDNIILLGGYNYKDDQAIDKIFKFSTNKTKSKKLTLLKAKLHSITCQHVCAVLKVPHECSSL